MLRYIVKTNENNKMFKKEARSNRFSQKLETLHKFN